MTDEQLDRLVRDADPVPRALAARLGGAEQTLLEEIMSTPRLDTAGSDRPRRGRWQGVAGAAAAAAVVAGIFAASTLLLRHDPAGTMTEPAAAPSAAAPSEAATIAPEVEGDYPRLLIDEPGWTATYVHGFTGENGDVSFRKGGREIGMTWYQDELYQSYYDDRLDVSKPETTTVAGTPASIVTYSDNDFAAMLRPHDGVFVELRTSAAKPGADTWTRASFDRFLTRVVRADQQSFLAAMPSKIVTPAEVQDEARKLLAGVPLPPGFAVSSLPEAGAHDPYQFGALVSGRVACGWISEWVRADKAGDDSARRAATEALRGSRDWKMLKDMAGEGAYPQALFEITAKVVAGKVPAGYEAGLGC
ncbi:hypothetical protein [Actinoplanes sp. DH11]|uniref:hypothetical protein n=1 Tax=Actinoplanes sp. DH11 TaxID=2857011 RepID=UPI001E3EF77C|nr:hypothetical protein [Actinoplanes sp. DH11]